MPVEGSTILDTSFDIKRLHIRQERGEDVNEIGLVTAKAFAPMPFGDGTEAQLVETLRAASALTVSLVATLDDALVGHVAFSPVTINDRPSDWYQLSPISVAPQVQRRGVGSALIGRGLDRLRGLRAGGCVLLGDPDYYGRFGFLSDPELTYQGKANRFFQRLILNDPSMIGDVSFHPAFNG
jgi:putative acetyltransferase